MSSTSIFGRDGGEKLSATFTSTDFGIFRKESPFSSASLSNSDFGQSFVNSSLK